MVVNIFQLHGVDSLLHLLVLQRQWVLLLLHLQFSKKNDQDSRSIVCHRCQGVWVLQVQQPPLLHQLLHHLHIVEASFVTSVKVVDMLLLSVLVEEP